MPIYVYETPDGEMHEVSMTIAEMIERQAGGDSITLQDGRVGTRNYRAEQIDVQRNKRCGLWPRTSAAVGVGEDQIEKAYKDSVDRGIPTEFTPEGDAVFRSKGHEAAYLKSIGFHHLDEAYSGA
jgi:hypothetical protein